MTLITDHHFVSTLNDLAPNLAPSSANLASAWQTDSYEPALDVSVGSGPRLLPGKTHSAIGLGSGERPRGGKGSERFPYG